MKKVTLIVVGLLLTLAGFSQNFNRVLRCSKLEFSGEQWTATETQYPSDQFVIMKDWDITIGTYKLKTYDAPEKTAYEDHVCYTWKAVNPEGEKCFFMIKKFRPEVSTHMLYSVVYPQYSLMYEYETE
jgi:hypothetical protein